MATGIISRVVADVKCYFCGHISGQIIGRRNEPLRVTNFVPRPGYTGPEVRPGMRLRCERCQGPVFLEDTSSVVRAPPAEIKTATRRSSQAKAYKRGVRAA